MTLRKTAESETAEQLARDFLTRVWGENPDYDAIDELMREDYQIHSAGTTVSGRAEFKAWVQSFHQRMPGAHNDIQEIFANASGDRVTARWICRGRNNGMFGCPADQQPIAFSGLSVWRIENAQLVECWVERSGLEAFLALSNHQG